MSKKNLSKKRRSDGRFFWDKEYQSSHHLALSDKPSSDLKKFMKWLTNEYGDRYVRSLNRVVDLGCGNGRNLIYLADTYGMKGTGYDISERAIAEAQKNIQTEDIVCEKRNVASTLPLEDGSQALALDMMTSHFLSKEEREALVTEIARVLRDDGWLFFKTFLRDGDLHAERLLKKYPAQELGSYIHPQINVPEHVYTESEIHDLLGEYFTVIEVHKSKKHVLRGKAAKRRSISVYAQKK